MRRKHRRENPAGYAGFCCFATLVWHLTLRGGNVNRTERDRVKGEVVAILVYKNHLSKGSLWELSVLLKTSLMNQL